MGQGRLTLDNQIFAQTLRQPRRSVPAYQHRPTHPQTTEDMMFIRSSQVASGPARTPVQASLPKSVLEGNCAATMPPPAPSAQPSVKQAKRGRHPMPTSPLVLYAMAAMLFVAGGYVVFSSLRANDHVKAQVQQLQSTAESSDDAGDAPTDEKPSVAAVNGYTVAPSLARYLDIPKLGVHARVRPLGVKNDNTLKAPTNGYDVGWYDASSRPGENGAMLVDGHSNVLGKNAVFAQLGKLAAGDVLKITRGDGVVLIYTVRSVQTVDDDKVDMSSLLISADTAKPGLNLITCAGDVIPGSLHLDKRTLVRAVLE